MSQTVSTPRASRAWLGALGAVLGLLLVDLALRLQIPGTANPRSWSAEDTKVYAVGAVWSLGSWALGLTTVRHLAEKRRWSWVSTAAVSIASGILFPLSFAYRVYFYQSPSWQALAFALREPKNALAIGAWSLGAFSWFIMVASGVALYWGLARFVRAPSISLPSPGLASLFIGGYVVVSYYSLYVPDYQDPLPVDTNLAAAVTQLLWARSTSDAHLVTPVRPPVPAQPPGERPNVLLLIHESFRADAVFADLDYRYLDARQIAPFGSTVPDRRAQGYIVFPKARTNSTATESSVPTILSGIDLGNDPNAYGHAHSLWSIAKAAGAHTFLFSAQSYSFSHFDEFFLDRNVDVAKTGEDLSRDFVNDMGIDDGIAVDAALAHLRTLADAKRPFVGVIHFNATHVPGYPGPGVEVPAGASLETTYVLAARYMDRLTERIDRALRDSGLDRTTVVIATADHGENVGPGHPVERLGSYYEPTVRIPLWMKFPAGYLATHPQEERALDAHRTRNVQNTDLLPTVRDLLGMSSEGALDERTLPGRSLVRAPAGEDAVSGQSTCLFRAWNLEGFYLVKDDVKVIVSSDQKTPQIYDLRLDPREEHNRWDDASYRNSLTPWISKKVAEGEGRRQICAKLARVCPFLASAPGG